MATSAMIAADQFMPIVLRLVPEFSEQWGQHLEYWGDQVRGTCIDMSEFSIFVIDQLSGGQYLNIAAILIMMEDFLEKGDDELKNIVQTCFLENLLNVTPSKLNPDLYVPFLGERSRDFCRIWDTFTGDRTRGLW